LRNFKTKASTLIGILNILKANFGAIEFGYPCRALYKPSDFLQNLLDANFKPIVPMAAI